MKKIFFILTLLCMSHISLQAQTNYMSWKQYFGSIPQESAVDFTTDSSGNIYITGTTTGDLNGTNLGSSDIFLTKYTPNGNIAWIQQYGSSSHDYVKSIATDSSGNIFLTGETYGDINGDLDRSVSTDSFLTKFTPNGTLVWTYQYELPGSATAVAIDSNDNIYVAERGASLAKFTPSGNLEWRQSHGGGWEHKMGIDANDNIYIGGVTSSDLNSSQNGEVFLTKFSSDGMQKWIREYGVYYDSTNHATIVNSLLVVDNGTVYIGGNQGISTAYGFLSITDANGTQIDYFRDYSDGGYSQSLHSIAADSNGSTYLMTGSSFVKNKLDYSSDWVRDDVDIYGHVTIDDNDTIYNLGSENKQITLVRYAPIFINDLSSTAEKEQFEPLTFSVDYELHTGRTLGSLLYDFNGTYTSHNVYTFNHAGNYQVVVKITDDQNNSATETFIVSIAAKSFEDMTFEQKIIDQVDPQHLSAIQQEIDSQSTSAFTNGYDSGFSDGNQSGYDQGRADAVDDCKAFPDVCGIKPKVVVIPL